MKKTAFILLFLSVFTGAIAQVPPPESASDIFHRLQKLNVLGNALYVAAHPDDENTAVISYLSNGQLVNTAYLSMTRGDGGQNLIGPEIREQLGIIRTQELLAARRVDGGEQFFTRANDFGYSKNTEETQRIWERENVLGDVVWTFRNYRPDVVLLRFPPDARAGHGHHTTASILALEAFSLSNDANAYPEQLKTVSTWQPKRIFVNTGRWWNTTVSEDTEGVSLIDVGAYNPSLGMSYSEIAALSRSQHKSQGFGSSGSRGRNIELMEFMDGLEAADHIFDGIDITWGRVEGGKAIESKVNRLINNFDVSNPSKSVPELLEVRKMVDALKDSYWRQVKLSEIDQLLLSCTGTYILVTSSSPSVVPGATLPLSAEITNRSEVSVRLKEVSVNKHPMKISDQSLTYNNPARIQDVLNVPKDMPISNPYWLNKKGVLGMYAVDDPLMIGKPENDPSFEAIVNLEISGQLVSYTYPVVYKTTDRVKGEVRQRVIVIPPVMVDILEPVTIFSDDQSRQVSVRVIAGEDDLEADVALQLPGDWKVTPESQKVNLAQKNMEKTLRFMITPPSSHSDVVAKAVANINGHSYDRGRVIIDYDHIPVQTLFPKAESRFVRLDIKTLGARIGYLQGAGDAIPESLEAIGYTVVEMDLTDITPENLNSLDVFIVGVRGLNTHPELKSYKSTILDFVRAGGNLIYQYNTSQRIMSWENYSPYAIDFTGNSSDSRVSVEEAEITMLLPEHPVLNTPNKITSKDFDGWVQERGLYFPNQWAPEFQAILSSHDPGEPPKNGGLLVAQYGKGYFVYTGYSWFRELPAGVPGAYRLFTNIISLGKDSINANEKSANE